MGSHIYFLLMNNNDVQSHRLKGIVVGGMKLNNKKRKQFEKKFKTNIYITYGLTETTAFATSQVPNTAIVKDSVGKPLAVNEINLSSSPLYSLKLATTILAFRVLVFMLLKYSLEARLRISLLL